METQGASGIGALKVQVDGFWFVPGEKYTILELGWAVYLGDPTPQQSSLEQWIRIHGETRPSEDGWSQLSSGYSMLITSHPILVAMAIHEWWGRNGQSDGLKPGDEVSIPSFEEAVEVVKNRKIINPVNRKYSGKVPGLDLWSDEP